MSFREDGAAALEWAARYLETVGDLPVLAQVKPGEIRSRLPASPPDDPEPFEALLRDLDEVLVPGMTHWQHPRYFAYFAVSGSRPGILAELEGFTTLEMAETLEIPPGTVHSRLRAAKQRLAQAIEQATQDEEGSER